MDDSFSFYCSICVLYVLTANTWQFQIHLNHSLFQFDKVAMNTSIYSVNEPNQVFGKRLGTSSDRDRSIPSISDKSSGSGATSSGIAVLTADKRQYSKKMFETDFSVPPPFGAPPPIAGLNKAFYIHKDLDTDLKQVEDQVSELDLKGLSMNTKDLIFL